MVPGQELDDDVLVQDVVGESVSDVPVQLEESEVVEDGGAAATDGRVVPQAHGHGVPLAGAVLVHAGAGRGAPSLAFPPSPVAQRDQVQQRCSADPVISHAVWGQAATCSADGSAATVRQRAAAVEAASSSVPCGGGGGLVWVLSDEDE